MPPKPLTIAKEDVLAAAREVAQTEHQPSRAKVASRLGLIESTFNKRLRSEGWVEEVDKLLHPAIGNVEVEAPGIVEHDDGTASLISDPNASNLWTPSGLLTHYGLDPDEWEIIRARPNIWGDPAEPRHQLRLDLIPRRLLITAPDPGKWKPPPKPKARKRKQPETVVLAGDQHCPLHDKTLHRLFCDYLRDERPDRGVLLGDLLDFPTVSRFREREGFAATVNECLEAGFRVLMDYRDASPDTQWTMLLGNHDCRLGYALIDNAKALHNVTAAGDNVPALNLRRLLHLDKLNIELIDGEWDTTKVALSRNLTARHGYTTVKTAGDKMLTKLSRSTVVGHSHRMSLTLRTEHDQQPEEPTSTRVAVEAGCMAEIADGLGHSVDPDWHNGFIIAHLYSDGDFHLAPAVYVPGRLMVPGGKRYE